MGIAVAVVLWIILCVASVTLFHFKEKRLQALKWPQVGRAKIAILIARYLKSRGWRFEHYKLKQRYDAVATNGDICLLIACVEANISEQKSTDTIIDEMASYTSFLRGLHNLGVVYITFIRFSPSVQDVMYKRNILHLHVSDLALLRDIRDVELEHAASIDRRQLRLLTYSHSITKTLVVMSRDRCDWSTAIRIAEMGVESRPWDNHARTLLEQTKRIAEARSGLPINTTSAPI